MGKGWVLGVDPEYLYVYLYVILFTFINKLQLQYTVTNTQDFGNKIRESHPTDLGQLSLTSVKKFLNEPF